jgi:hypothetical protein
LNLVRLFIPNFYHHNYEVQISVVNKDFVTKNTSYIFDETGVKHGLNSVVRRPHLFDIDTKRTSLDKYSQRKYMKILNYEKLNKILMRNDNISITLFNSLQWIGMYTKERNINLKFLFLVFALEGIFTNENNNYSSITASVSEKAAFLIARNKTDRKKIFDFVKEMYGKRGKIVHGSGQMINDSELIGMYQVIIDTFYHTTNVIEKYDIKTTAKFNEFLTNKKFS